MIINLWSNTFLSILLQRTRDWATTTSWHCHVCNLWWRIRATSFLLQWQSHYIQCTNTWNTEFPSCLWP